MHLWPPLEYLLQRLAEPQVAITLGLSIISFGLWQVLKRGVTRRILFVTAAAVSCYLVLSALVIVSALVYVAQHSEIWQAWLNAVFAARPARRRRRRSVESRLAVGLAADRLVVLSADGARAERLRNDHERRAARQRRRGRRSRHAGRPRAQHAQADGDGRVDHGRVPGERGRWSPRCSCRAPNSCPAARPTHRALAYLAHGSPLADGASGAAVNPLFGDGFGDLFDLSSAFILCLAGVSVTMGLQNLLPHYLNRLGMEVSWAGKAGVIMHVLNVIILLVTVVFRASPSLATMGLRHQRAGAARRGGARRGQRPAAECQARPQTHRVGCSRRRRRRILPGDDRPHGADQPLGPDDRLGLRAGDSRQLVCLALDSLHRAAVRGLRIRRRTVAAAMGRTCAARAPRCSCRIVRA